MIALMCIDDNRVALVHKHGCAAHFYVLLCAEVHSLPKYFEVL